MSFRWTAANTVFVCDLGTLLIRSELKTLADHTDQIEHLMYGHNFQVVLGVHDLGPCPTLTEVRERIKQEFPGTDPFIVEFGAAGQQDFWSDLQGAFTYRGDPAAGFEPSEKEEVKLLQLQKDFQANLAGKISEGAHFYYYPDEEGIPGYPVYWDFRYIIWQESRSAFFVFGAASD